jgi:hypothetical protein
MLVHIHVCSRQWMKSYMLTTESHIAEIVKNLFFRV